MRIQWINNNLTGWCLSFLMGTIPVSCNTKQPVNANIKQAVEQSYRCPMHHEIIRNKPGTCPICGMGLVAFGGGENMVTQVNLTTLLKPTNRNVLSSVPVTNIKEIEETIEIHALGTIQYDTREMGSISARVSGRIEKLYLKYTFQEVKKGQKVMDIYSPELLTAQQDLLFLVMNDSNNVSFINSAKDKLLLLGMSNEQLIQVLQIKKPTYNVSVYSNYSGHIHDALNTNMTASMSTTPSAGQQSLVTRDLMLKEGMYIQKGQTVLSVMNPNRLWAVVNIYADDQYLVKKGNPTRILAEAAPEMNFSGKIDIIEPVYREGNKTLTARVSFKNDKMIMLPVGSQLKATIFTKLLKTNWLPKTAVISLGLDKIVFKKQNGVFKAYKIAAGITYKGKIQIIEGLSKEDEVAADAQFLMDSESFIKIND